MTYRVVEFDIKRSCKTNVGEFENGRDARVVANHIGAHQIRLVYDGDKMIASFAGSAATKEDMDHAREIIESETQQR